MRISICTFVYDLLIENLVVKLKGIKILMYEWYSLAQDKFIHMYTNDYYDDDDDDGKREL